MTPRQVVENYWRVECTRDVDATVACYEPTAELVVPGLGRLVGHAQIRRFYQESVDRFPALAVEIASVLEDGDRGAFEWRSVFHDRAGDAFRSNGVNVVRVAGDKLREVHVYYDPTQLDAPADRPSPDAGR